MKPIPRSFFTLAMLSAVGCSDEATRNLPRAARPASEFHESIALASQFPPRPTDNGAFLLQPRHASRASTTGAWLGTSHFPGVVLPRSGNEPMLVHVPSGPTLSVRWIQAAPVVAEQAKGVLHYRRLRPNLDTQVFATEHGVEDLWTLHAPTSDLGYDVELPHGWTLRASKRLPLVEVRDATNASRLRVWAGAAWTADGDRVAPTLHVEASRILVRLPETTSWPVVVDPEWTASDTLVLPRRAPTLTPLPSGQLWVAGGDASATGTCERFDPVTGTFSEDARLLFPREGHAAHVLPSGKVLLLGGHVDGAPVLQPEVYDPVLGTPYATPLPPQSTVGAASASLADGRVLIAGGSVQVAHDGLQVYDPDARTFTRVGSLAEAREQATATLLATGQVLVAGGLGADGKALASTEVCSPEGGCAPGPDLHVARHGHTATLLPSGSVAVVGGVSPMGSPPPVEVLNVASSSSEKLALTADRIGHQTLLLPDGRLLVVGGQTLDGAVLQQADLVDPASVTIQPDGTVGAGRDSSAALLFDGRVLLLGGNPAERTAYLRSLPIHGEVVDASATVRPGHTATLLPNGDVLLAGGGEGETTVELWERKTSSLSATAPMTRPRTHHAAVLLRSGRTLVTGGTFEGVPTPAAEVYEWRQGTFGPVGDMQVPRVDHALTLLGSGRVLVTGGSSDGTVEEFDPAEGRFEAVGRLLTPRHSHVALVLPTGQVLVAGGLGTDGSPVSKVELWDPTERRSELVPNSTAGGGIAAGSMSAMGDAVVATDGSAFLYSALDGRVVPRSAPIRVPFAAMPSFFEGVLLCGHRLPVGPLGGCALAGARADGTSSVTTFPGNFGYATATRLTDGDLLIRGASGDTAHTSLVHRVPPSAVRPAIEKGPLEVRVGTDVLVHGRRFASPTAVGSEKLGSMPSLVPGVVFLPAYGPPLLLPVQSWADDALTFRVPPTSYHGRGWLHVVVAGVPSVGWFLEMQPKTLGETCETGGECGSGFCAAGVCCETRCDQPCLSCWGSWTGGQDGRCAPVLAGQDPHEACEQRVCDTTGTCDGKGACALFEERTPCDEGKLCRERWCVSTLGDRCASKRDCAGGQICGARGVCEDLAPREPVPDPGACALGHVSRQGASLFWAGVLLALAVSRRALTAWRRGTPSRPRD